MLSLSLFLFLVVVFVFHHHYLRMFRLLLENPESLADVLEKSWVVLILTLVSPFVSYFLGILTIAKHDLYYTIDNVFFKRRKKVDRFICDSMLNFRIKLTEGDKQGISRLKQRLDKEDKCRQIMFFFYHFIEKEGVVNPELRKQAFTYWGDYFSNVIFVFWGVLVLLAMIGVALLDHSISFLRLLAGLIVLVLIALNLKEIFWGKNAKKQFEIPEIQIAEIHRHAAGDLLRDLRAEGFFLNDDKSSQV